MKKLMILLIIIIGGLFIFSNFTKSEKKWKNSIGIISDVTKLDDEIYGCKLSYKIETKNKKPEIITQFYMDLKDEPVENQELKLKYNSNEPIEYILLDSIRYKKKS